MNLAAPSSIERLLIVRLSAMGDVIHTLPAAEALRAAFPKAMIGWLVEERWSDLLCAPGTPRRGARSEGRPLVDWVHTVNLKAWRKSLFTISTTEKIARVWNDLRGARYDVAIDLQGAIRSAVLARWSGARVVWGAMQPRESAASLWYTRQAIARGAHVVDQNVSVANAISGLSIAAPAPSLPRDPESEKRIAKRLADAAIGEFAILNPGAGWGAKRWPAERYGLVARELADRDMKSIVNFGPGEEALARETEAASLGSAVALQCSISELIALTRRAELFIGGDTGPLHLAAALGVPVVAIFGPTDPARNGPFGTRSVVLRNPASATTHARNPKPDEAMLDIGIDDVVNASRALMAGGQKCPPHAEARHG